MIKSPEASGEAHLGLVHSLVARMEGRLAVMVAARADELSDGQRRIEWMVDRLALMYLMHTPEVPEELRDGAVATATRRYTKYRQVVEDLLAKRDTGGVERDSQDADEE